MSGRIVVSGGEGLRVFDAADGRLIDRTPLERSGALCAGGDALFAAAQGDSAIYRLSARSLLPEGVYAGGPGLRALCLSRGGERLYALLSDADSVLMLAAGDGAPLVLARVGVNPQNMRLDDTGNLLVIAGGEDGCAYLLCSRTLRLMGRFCGDGICVDALCRGGAVHALLLTRSLSSRLMTFGEDGQRVALPLAGPPGALADEDGALYAAAGERLYRIAGDGVLGAHCVPGRAGKLLSAGDARLMLDPLTEMLHIYRPGGGWRVLCDRARDAAFVPHSESPRGAYSS